MNDEHNKAAGVAPEQDYLRINRDAWDLQARINFRSEFYNVEGFLEGASSLNDIELELLGDVHGKRILHLQCHFGQDSLSLARLGAEVTGVDLSGEAVDYARELAQKIGVEATFLVSDVYDLRSHLDEQFDLVFTSYGVIGWLPDMERWAALIAHYLKPGGRLVFAEFHPVVWMFDNDFQKVAYRYFNDQAIVETLSGTYAEPDADVQLQTITWNHGLGEVVNSLIHAGLQIQSLQEYDYSPYNCFRHTEEFAPGKFRIRHFENFIPMVYSIAAVKPR